MITGKRRRELRKLAELHSFQKAVHAKTWNDVCMQSGTCAWDKLSLKDAIVPPVTEEEARFLKLHFDHLTCGHIETIESEKTKAERCAQRNSRAADEVRKRKRHLRRIAPKGGRATAHYTDAEIVSVFTAYKNRHPGTSAWDAANALIRRGQPLDKYKTVTGPLNRATRIAQNAQSLTLKVWFDEL
jgi:hypothetical protein